MSWRVGRVFETPTEDFVPRPVEVIFAHDERVVLRSKVDRWFGELR
jgi:hypothetical protein